MHPSRPATGRILLLSTALALVAGAALAESGTGAPSGAAQSPAPLEYAAKSPVVEVPAMPGEWLAKHDVRSSMVDWRFDRLPTARGFHVEVTARTPAGLQLAVKCENANPTMEKPKFTTNAVDRVVLDFDEGWFSQGDRLDLLCVAGGQRHVEHLIDNFGQARGALQAKGAASRAAAASQADLAASAAPPQPAVTGPTQTALLPAR
jgi:hypothetical protein